MAPESDTQPQARVYVGARYTAWGISQGSVPVTVNVQRCQPHPDPKVHRKNPIHLNSLAVDRSCIASDFPPTYIKRKSLSGTLIRRGSTCLPSTRSNFTLTSLSSNHHHHASCKLFSSKGQLPKRFVAFPRDVAMEQSLPAEISSVWMRLCFSCRSPIIGTSLLAPIILSHRKKGNLCTFPAGQKKAEDVFCSN